MRAHHSIAIAAVVLLGFGLMLLFFSVPFAEYDIRLFQSDLPLSFSSIWI